MSNMYFLCKLTIVIPQLLCLFSIAKAVLSTLELLNLETSDSVNLVNLMMGSIVSKCLPIEQVPCSDRGQRTW